MDWNAAAQGQVQPTLECALFPYAFLMAAFVLQGVDCAVATETA